MIEAEARIGSGVPTRNVSVKAGSLSVLITRPSQQGLRKRSIRRSSSASTLRTGPIRSKLRVINAVSRRLPARRLRAVHKDGDLIALTVADDRLAIEADPAMGRYPVLSRPKRIDSEMQLGRIAGPAQEFEAQSPSRRQRRSRISQDGGPPCARAGRHIPREPGIIEAALGDAIARICSKRFPRRATAANVPRAKGSRETGRQSGNPQLAPNPSFAADDHAFLLQAFRQLGEIGPSTSRSASYSAASKSMISPRNASRRRDAGRLRTCHCRNRAGRCRPRGPTAPSPTDWKDATGEKAKTSSRGIDQLLKQTTSHEDVILSGPLLYGKRDAGQGGCARSERLTTHCGASATGVRLPRPSRIFP